MRTAGLWLDGKANDVRKKLCNTRTKGPLYMDGTSSRILVASMPRKGENLYQVEDLENLDKILKSSIKGSQNLRFTELEPSGSFGFEPNYGRVFRTFSPGSVGRLLNGETTATWTCRMDSECLSVLKNPDSKPLEELR